MKKKLLSVAIRQEEKDHDNNRVTFNVSSHIPHLCSINTILVLQEQRRDKVEVRPQHQNTSLITSVVLRSHPAPICAVCSIQHLEEVLAGDDKGQLSAEVVRLGLAPSHALHQLRDVVGNRLDTPEHRAKGYSLPNRGYS